MPLQTSALRGVTEAIARVTGTVEIVRPDQDAENVARGGCTPSRVRLDVL
jgi:hypothetical protein